MEEIKTKEEYTELSIFNCIHELVTILCLAGIAFNILPVISYVYQFFIFLIVGIIVAFISKKNKVPVITYLYKEPVIFLTTPQSIVMGLLKIVAIIVILKLSFLVSFIIFITVFISFILYRMLKRYLVKLKNK